MKWIETTLRKGKHPKICRDMFITDSFGTFKLVKVKNGKVYYKVVISSLSATEYINEHVLIKVADGIFKNCASYRTHKSTKLVNTLITKSKLSASFEFSVNKG